MSPPLLICPGSGRLSGSYSNACLSPPVMSELLAVVPGSARPWPGPALDRTRPGASGGPAAPVRTPGRRLSSRRHFGPIGRHPSAALGGHLSGDGRVTVGSRPTAAARCFHCRPEPTDATALARSGAASSTSLSRCWCQRWMVMPILEEIVY